MDYDKSSAPSIVAAIDKVYPNAEAVYELIIEAGMTGAEAAFAVSYLNLLAEDEESE